MLDTLERTDFELIADLDFDPVTACEIETAACTKTATHLIMCKACGADAPICEACIVRCRADLADAQRSWSAVMGWAGGTVAAQCNICKGMRPEFDALWLITPLKGGGS